VLDDPYEVIVVDDASTDGTVAAARAGGARVLSVDFRQISRVRNAGAAAASGDILIFVDADTTVNATTVSASVSALRQGAAGGGADVHFDGRIPFWGRLLLPAIRVSMRIGRFASGCYIYCARAAFEQAGGFDEGYYAAEEIIFSRALQRCGRVVILREPVVTSGRKLRTHSIRDLLRLCAATAGRGTAAVRSRDALELWYGARRDDT
jgi:glycosyltransferase involved in cell wall biosynthesis